MGKQANQKRAKRSTQAVQSDPPWTPLERAIGANGSHVFHDGTHEFRVFKNSRYTVMRRVFEIGPDQPPMVHLSIRRNDRRPLMNWRDFQKIKNEMVGTENEGVQIFPAESRLVDNANQYHIYVCSDPEHRLPFGYNERLLSEGSMCGAVQEPFEPHVRPDDLIPEEELRRAFEIVSAQRKSLGNGQVREYLEISPETGQDQPEESQA